VSYLEEWVNGGGHVCESSTNVNASAVEIVRMQDGVARFPCKHAEGTAVAEEGSEGGAKELR
jgi:hypothetical protein